MKRHVATCATIVALVSLVPLVTRMGSIYAAPEVNAKRVQQNPLITIDSSRSLGGNVNGPTVIRVPDWVERPLGRYYMYFANHKGDFIRLAYADSPTGPWRVYEPGVLHVRETAFFRPQPDPKETLDTFYTHVASPEIFVDIGRKRLVMWYHGYWTNGERWPSDPVEAQAWARQKGYSQFTQAAESTDGLHFDVRPSITKTNYLRVFRYGGYFYALSRLGQLSRAAEPLESFQIGPNPFRDGPYANRVRHVALVLRGNRLRVFFTAIGDAPERVLMSTIDLTQDWTAWHATAPAEVLQPEVAYECSDLPTEPSEPGEVEVRVRQIRDPFVFEEQGRAYLFYSTCGEQGIAAAEIEFR
jgi:hypothetical protein